MSGLFGSLKSSVTCFTVSRFVSAYTNNSGRDMS